MFVFIADGASQVTSPDESQPSDKRVAEWSVDEVCAYLSAIDGIKLEIVESFRKEEISGKILEPKRDLLEEVHPGMTVGQKRLIMEALTSLFQSEQKGKVSPKDPQSPSSSRKVEETFRKFDTESGLLVKYKQNRVFPKIESRPGNLLEPVHRYIPCCDYEDMSLIFTEEVLKFAAACMNERTNGTIHFGVGDRYSDEYTEGQILGLRIDKTQLTRALDSRLSDAFSEEKVHLAEHCIRPPDFVEVIAGRGDNYRRYVVEVDIEPSSEMCGGQVFGIKLHKGGKSKSSSRTVYTLKSGIPTALAGDGMQSFMEAQNDLDKLRVSKEQKVDEMLHTAISPLSSKSLQNRLIDLFCRGEDNLNGEIYPVLVVSSPNEHMTRKWMKKNISFIKNVPWRVVFDFGDGGENSLFRYLEDDEEEVTRVLTSESFDPRAYENAANPHQLKNNLDSLKTSSHLPWVFVNGYADLRKEGLPTHEWKKQRASGYKEAVRFFHNEIPEKRATVMFLILSGDYDVLTHAADELCTRFQNKWFIVSENEQIAKPLFSEFLGSKIVGSLEEVQEKSVVGMPFSHVNATIQRLLGCVDDRECIIPTSTGTIRLRDKIKNGLVDLEIIGCNQCDGIIDEGNLHDYGQSMEEKYYMGMEVDWWNFYLKTHVLKRQCHERLEHEVREVLGGRIPEDERIGRVTLAHQPGAGGTTSSRQILWDLRKEYRCGVVKNLSDQTCDQISRLHMYEDEEHPRPLLLLLDNYEDERVSDLKARLEEQCRLTSRRMERAPFVFYVFLVCRRRSSCDNLSTQDRHILKHDLHTEELYWFQQKYTHLEKNYKEQQQVGKQRIEPRLLISFNILKENFSPDYIQRTVQELTAEIRDPNERNLLKYIALLNSYDLFFRPLPAAGFDILMDSVLPARQTFRPAQQPRWENYISSALKVLLNETSRPGRQKKFGIRIINNLLSKTILEHLLQRDLVDGQKSKTSDIMKEFLECGIFSCIDNAVEQLLAAVRDLMKKRARKPDGNYETKFSPMIQAIVDDKEQGVSDAASVLEKVFDLSEDVFVAQHLARLYIFAENWKEATKFAKIITNQKPDNSFLWDTFGNVFKGQMLAHRVECIKDEGAVSARKACDVIDLALHGLDTFHKEQSVSKADMANVNHAGFFGEIEITVHLLVYLAHVEGLQDIRMMRKFLVDSKYIPDELDCLGPTRVGKLKDLQQQIFQVMTLLDDEFLQLRDDVTDLFRRNFNQFQNSKLIRLKEDIENYFGEDNNEPPLNLSEEEQCLYRRRRMIRLGGTSFRSIYDLKKSQQDGKQNLETIQELVGLNLRSQFRSSFDFQTKIRVSIALSNVSSQENLDISQAELAEMSRILYDQEITSLEVYLFACMFNWPRENPGLQFAIPANKIPDIMKEWKIAYYKMYPRQKEENRQGKKKETTMFFLAKGSGMAAFAHQQELRQLHFRGDKVWRTHVGISRLQRVKGTLLQRGLEVSTALEEKGNKTTVALIPTSFPITDPAMWNKNVYFVLGFTWSGPRAYDVDVENPETATPVDLKRREIHPFQSGMQSRFYANSSYVYFQKEVGSLQKKLDNIRIIRDKKSRGGGLNEKEVSCILKSSCQRANICFAQ